MNEEELSKVIKTMRQRNTKEAIQKHRDDYYGILSKVTGKKKPVSMY